MHIRKTAIIPTLLLPLLFANNSSALTADQLNTISQGCNTIKSSLTQLQRADSRVRTHLGSSYEKILTNFMRPLNLRIVNNNLSSATLVSIQSDFALYRSNFSSDFITYSQSLENLIATDCQNSPQEFYNRLVTTRKLREVVRRDVESLSNVANTHRSAVLKFEGKL